MDEASAPGETGPPNVSRVGRSDTEDRDHEGLERVSGGGGRGGWSRDPTCKWCAFIVSKELRMNM